MQQKDAIEIVCEERKNAFITGPPGTGKTFLLNECISKLRKKGLKVAVTASTGIAATHLSGRTVHSWSGIGVKNEDYLVNHKGLEEIVEKPYYREAIQNTDVLIIDELSMLHAYQLDAIDIICKSMKKSTKPFGGLQVILSGDFFQLPPVSTARSRTGAIIPPEYTFSSHAWTTMGLYICYLEKQYRQTDSVLKDILYEIRANDVSDESKKALENRMNVQLNSFIEPVKLYPRNESVDSINNYKLVSLPGDIVQFKMVSYGSNPKTIEIFKKSCLALQTFNIKVGAAVMFLKNNYNKGYVNGTLGKVTGFDKDSGFPIVKTIDNKSIIAFPESWKLEEYNMRSKEYEVAAELIQVPLRLAWALTIHKSQGMTLDSVEMDLSDAFTPGQGYVALSRGKALNMMRLFGINDMALTVDYKIIEIDKQLQDISNKGLQVK